MSQNLYPSRQYNRAAFLFVESGRGHVRGAGSRCSGHGKPQDQSGRWLNTEVDRLSHQLGILEDEKAIRTLHQTYETLLDSGKYEEVVGLFAEDAEVVFNGGVFKGKKRRVPALSRLLPSGLDRKEDRAGAGLRAGSEQQQEIIEVAADRLSARAQFPYSIQVGAPMAADSTLVKMARLHGEGIMKWCESGIYEISYAKDG